MQTAFFLSYHKIQLANIALANITKICSKHCTKYAKYFRLFGHRRTASDDNFTVLLTVRVVAVLLHFYFENKESIGKGGPKSCTVESNDTRKTGSEKSCLKLCKYTFKHQEAVVRIKGTQTLHWHAECLKIFPP